MSKKRASKVHGKRKNLKETIIIFIGVVLILFLVFSVTRAIVQKGVKRLTNDKDTKLIIETPKKNINPPKKLSFTPTPLIKKEKTKTPRPSITPTIKRTPKKPKSPKPSSTPVEKAVVRKGFYIQLGAFKSKANAENLVKKIKALGYKNVRYIKAKSLYKVRIFGFSSRDSAILELEKLKKKGFEGFIGKNK